MLTTVYLVRHGQTAWNKEEIFRGRTDLPLDETGLVQAESVGKYFEGTEIHVIYSSPLARARQTAEKIARIHNLEIQPLDGIIDMSFGHWEGHPHQEIQKMDPETYKLWRKEPHRVTLPGGESLDQVRIRAMAALEQVIERYPGKTAVLVSHRVINKVLLCAVLGLDNSHFWQIKQDTTAINRIDYTKGLCILSLMNETCHLKALKERVAKVDF